jgi:hypothetical protein
VSTWLDVDRPRDFDCCANGEHDDGVAARADDARDRERVEHDAQ